MNIGMRSHRNSMRKPANAGKAEIRIARMERMPRMESVSAIPGTIQNLQKKLKQHSDFLDSFRKEHTNLKVKKRELETEIENCRGTNR
jgi:molecular chaperone DnaK (HSP70)